MQAQEPQLLASTSSSELLSSYLQHLPSQAIKKMKLQYPQCQRKGFHEAEQLTFVCVDAQCPDKGLICPVCRESDHKDHEAMHVKSFLGKLHEKIVISVQNNEHKQELTSNNDLASKLLALELGRDQMMDSLRETVKNLTVSIKQLEKKIMNTYVQARRLLLSQTSISTKLPNLLKVLIQSPAVVSQPSSLSHPQIQTEIRRFASLMEVKDDKIYIADDSNAIALEFKETSDKFIAHLLSVMTELPQKIRELPLKMKTLSKMSQENSRTAKTQSHFSATNKSDGLQLKQNGKKAQIKAQMGLGGIVFIEQQAIEEGCSEKKLSLRVSGSVSDSICVGVADIAFIQGTNFIIQQMGMNEGEVYGICAMGINLSDMQSPSFVFSGGDVLDLTLDIATAKLSISRRNSIEKAQIDLSEMGAEEIKKLEFFASLVVAGDCVQIVE